MIISNSLNADINVIIWPGNKTLLLRPCLPLPLPPLPFTRPSFYTFYSLIHLPFFPPFPFLIFLFLSFQPSFPFLSIYLPILTLISFSPSTSFFSNPYHLFPNTPHPPTPHPYLHFSPLPPSPPPHQASGHPGLHQQRAADPPHPQGVNGRPEPSLSLR